MKDDTARSASDTTSTTTPHPFPPEEDLKARLYINIATFIVYSTDMLKKAFFISKLFHFAEVCCDVCDVFNIGRTVSHLKTDKLRQSASAISVYV
jgi:hypothetical protein